jgi:hypothetical protein
VPAQWTVADRLPLVVKDAVIAILPAVLAICIIAAQRLNPSMFVGRIPKPNSAVDINNRFILNTVEQFILYFITILAGSEARSVANHEYAAISPSKEKL